MGENSLQSEEGARAGLPLPGAKSMLFKSFRDDY